MAKRVQSLLAILGCTAHVLLLLLLLCLLQSLFLYPPQSVAAVECLYCQIAQRPASVSNGETCPVTTRHLGMHGTCLVVAVAAVFVAVSFPISAPVGCGRRVFVLPDCTAPCISVKWRNVSSHYSPSWDARHMSCCCCCCCVCCSLFSYIRPSRLRP